MNFAGRHALSGPLQMPRDRLSGRSVRGLILMVTSSMRGGLGEAISGLL